MIMRNRLLLALGVSGWALLSALGKSRKNSQQQAKIQKKTELHRWEGEGGNLPTPATAAPATPEAR